MNTKNVPKITISFSDISLVQLLKAKKTKI